MSNRKKYKFILPIGILNVLSQSLDKPDEEIFDFYEILDKLFWIHMIHHNKKDFFLLDSRLRRRNKEELEYLIRQGVLMKKDFSRKQNKATTYKIDEDFLYGFKEFEVPSDSSCYLKLSIAHKNRDQKYRKYAKLKKCLKQIDFDYEGAVECLTSIEGPRQFYGAYALRNLKEVNFFRRNKTNNRIDSPLTVLPKELRKYIRNSAETDLKNSQPFFLAILFHALINQDEKLLKLFRKECAHRNVKLRKNSKYVPRTYTKQDFQTISKTVKNNIIQIKDTKKECEVFLNAATNGVIYEELGSRIGVSREEAKEIMIQRVMYGSDNKIFKEAFPALDILLQRLKKEGGAYLSVLLQRVEARIFIDEVAMVLVEKGISVLTIHDSVIVDKSNYLQAEQLLESVFKKEIGIVPMFKKPKSLEKRPQNNIWI